MSSIISVSQLSKTYASGLHALKRIDLEIRRGEIFALLGPNGAGKTTLISIVCGIVNPGGGRVLVGDEERLRIDGPGDGTSFATALCAGIAALWIAHRGADLDRAYGRHRWARAAAFKKLVAVTACTPPGWNTRDYGRGVYQADTLLTAGLPALCELSEESDL